MSGVLSSKFFPDILSKPGEKQLSSPHPSHGSLTPAYSIPVTSVLTHTAPHQGGNWETTGPPFPLQRGGGVLLGTLTLGLCGGLSLTTVLNWLLAILSPAQNGQRACIHPCAVWGIQKQNRPSGLMLREKTCFTKTMYANQRQETPKAEENCWMVLCQLDPN